MSPQVSLIEGVTELVYSKEIPHGSKMKFAKDETTGKLYFVVDGVYVDLTTLLYTTNIPVIRYGGVDLGLPNGTIWADRNVGAENPWDNGAYFSWGNVEGVVSNGTVSMLAKDALYKFAQVQGIPEEEIEAEMSQEGWEEMIKQILEGFGFVDGYSFDETTYPTTLGGQFTGSTLDAVHDAATVNMGSDWRMPTHDDIAELIFETDQYYIDLSGKTVAGPFDYRTGSSYKGLDGSELRSICFVKKDEEFDYNNRSNFIEFPFAGYCYGSLFGNEGLYGGVWTSSVGIGGEQSRYSLYFSSDGSLYGDTNGRYLYYGQSVRGVRA